MRCTAAAVFHPHDIENTSSSARPELDIPIQRAHTNHVTTVIDAGAAGSAWELNVE
jgi:hypothetical protein